MPWGKKLSSARLGELGGVGRSPGLLRELRETVAQERGPLQALGETPGDNVSEEEQCLQETSSWLIEIVCIHIFKILNI